MTDNRSVRDAFFKCLGRDAHALGLQDRRPVRRQVVHPSCSDRFDVVADARQGNHQQVQDETGVDARSDDRYLVLHGKLVNLFGKPGRLV